MWSIVFFAECQWLCKVTFQLWIDVHKIQIKYDPIVSRFKCFNKNVNGVTFKCESDFIYLFIFVLFW